MQLVKPKQTDLWLNFTVKKIRKKAANVLDKCDYNSVSASLEGTETLIKSTKLPKEHREALMKVYVEHMNRLFVNYTAFPVHILSAFEQFWSAFEPDELDRFMTGIAHNLEDYGGDFPSHYMESFVDKYYKTQPKIVVSFMAQVLKNNMLDWHITYITNCSSTNSQSKARYEALEGAYRVILRTSTSINLLADQSHYLIMRSPFYNMDFHQYFVESIKKIVTLNTLWNPGQSYTILPKFLIQAMRLEMVPFEDTLKWVNESEFSGMIRRKAYKYPEILRRARKHLVTEAGWPDNLDDDWYLRTLIK